MDKDFPLSPDSETRHLEPHSMGNLDSLAAWFPGFVHRDYSARRDYWDQDRGSRALADRYLASGRRDILENLAEPHQDTARRDYWDRDRVNWDLPDIPFQAVRDRDCLFEGSRMTGTIDWGSQAATEWDTKASPRLGMTAPDFPPPDNPASAMGHPCRTVGLLHRDCRRDYWDQAHLDSLEPDSMASPAYQDTVAAPASVAPASAGRPWVVPARLDRASPAVPAARRDCWGPRHPGNQAGLASADRARRDTRCPVRLAAPESPLGPSAADRTY